MVAHYRETGDKAVIGVLYERYLHLVLSVCRKYMNNLAEAEDRTMEVFEELFEKLSRHEIRYFSSWLYQVTKNHCLMYLRKNKSSAANPVMFEDYMAGNMEIAEEMHQLPEDQPPPEDLVGHALEKLNEGQRICVTAFYLQGKSYKQIAEETGYELKKVKSFIQNGKRNLKIILEKYHEDK